MKNIGWKTRLQWKTYVAMLMGLAIVVLFVPQVGQSVEQKNPVYRMLDHLFGGEPVSIQFCGKTIAVADSMESAKEAYKAARLKYNQKGITLIDGDVTYEYVEKQSEDQKQENSKILRGDALENQIYQCLAEKKSNRNLAYTMRVDTDTVTFDSMEDIVTVLEKIQSVYDTKDAFQVKLSQPESHNVSSYEVTVAKKDNVNLNQPITDSSNEQLKSQSQEDGVKNIRFADAIQVMATAARDDQLIDTAKAYDELAKEKGEEAVYVVQPGDYLELIARKNNMEVSELKELNPQITSDEDLYYDDRLNVVVPEAVISVLVDKQETYEEAYMADTVYEDDDSMFIGESSVVQEGQEGTHIVTDLVTYKGEVEENREPLEETVEVAAVAQVVKRGTKSKPTYMYPVTNWNVTSTFGYRWGRLHAGTDVGIPTGTTVRASRAGRVVTAGWVGGYGNCVMIDHGDGVQTRYGHLSQVLVSVGQYVDQGQQIALSGNTGRSTGPHLHFEVRVNGEATDATPYLEGRN